MNSPLLADDDDDDDNDNEHDHSRNTNTMSNDVAETITATTERSQFLETSFDETVVTRTETCNDQVNMNGNDVPSESSANNAGYRAVALYDYQACKYDETKD